jgi:hypothetical protein
MPRYAIVGLAVISACSAVGHDPPRAKPLEEPNFTGEATRAEPLAAARQPVSETYCAAACAAAAAQDCEKLAATCQYDTNGNDYVSLGGRVLHCKPACAAACAGHATGHALCVSQCRSGHGASFRGGGDL